MGEFIKGSINTNISDKHAVIRISEFAVEDCIADGVVCLEASIHLNLKKFFSDNIDELIIIASNLREKYSKQTDFRPEIGFNKIEEKGFAYEFAVRCMGSGKFYSIDMYGPELDVPIDDYVELYKLAERHNIKKKVHIGEFSDYKTIDDAIEKLNPVEIQHGINAVYSKKIMEKIRERNIRLNLCPASNIMLGAVESIERHPIRKLYDSGIDITINNDDLLLFDSTITDQYLMLIESGIFSFDEINEIRKNSLKR